MLCHCLPLERVGVHSLSSYLPLNLITPSGSEFCIVGGSLQTDKDIEGAILTVGDHDPEGFVKNHDKTRRMRHALVVR